MTTRTSWLRTVASALVAAAVVGAPYALLYLTVWNANSPYRTNDQLPGLVLIVAPFLAALVFALLSARRLDRAEWLRSMVFALAVAITVAWPWGSQAVSEGRRYESFSFGWAVPMGAVTLFLGLGGVAAAMAISRLLLQERRQRALRWVRPWHVGMVVGLAELAVVGVAAAIL